MCTVAMRDYFIKPVWFCTIFILIPCLGFSWGEGRNFIDDVEIYTIYIDSDYVFCGTNSDWGANVYGLFVFDRRTEQWNNYSKANTGIPNSIMAIQKVDSFVDVLAGMGTLRFKLPSLDYMVLDPIIGHAQLRGNFFRDSLVVGKQIYSIAGDSVLIKKDARRVTIGVFKRPEDYMHGFGGPTITDCFLYDSAVILTTAYRIYEANVAPSSEFLEFSPHDLSVKPWTRIKLSEEPLALLCVEQDDKEFWIGTNRGVYRVEKESMKISHYNITKGIVVVDTLEVHRDRWRDPPIIYEYYRGDTVELLGEKEHGMEIALPTAYKGYLFKDYVKEEMNVPMKGRVVRIKDPRDLKHWNYTITVKASNSWDSETVVEFYTHDLPSKEFVFSSKIDNWYLIAIPNTGWVPMKDLIFHMDEVPY